MRNIEKIIEYIEAQTAAECNEISQAATDDCERIHAEFIRAEQEEYWRAIDAGTRDTELRLERLNDLASAEAKKQIEALRQEMLEEAFALAARKLLELPESDYKALLERLGVEADCTPEALVARYRSVMTPTIAATLFD